VALRDASTFLEILLGVNEMNPGVMLQDLEVTDQHNVNLHSYADDSRLYVHYQRRDTASTIARLGHCVDDVGHWMAANRLQMNPAKTELLWAGSKHNISIFGQPSPKQLGSDRCCNC